MNYFLDTNSNPLNLGAVTQLAQTKNVEGVGG